MLRHQSNTQMNSYNVSDKPSDIFFWFVMCIRVETKTIYG